MGSGTGTSTGLAMSCIAGCVVTWEYMAVTSQGALDRWDKPFAYTYLVHSSYIFALPLWMATAAREAKQAKSGDGSDGRGRDACKLFAEAAARLWCAAAVLASLSAACAYLWYRSLALTNVPTNNVLYQTQCAFVFVLSAVFLREHVTATKMGAVALAFSGVAIVCSVPTTGTERANTPLGVVLTLASTCIYAIYEVAYTRLCRDHLRRQPLYSRAAAQNAGRRAHAAGGGAGAKVSDAADLPRHFMIGNDDHLLWRDGAGLGDERDALLVLGLVGFANMLLLWLALPLLDVAGLEKFEAPDAATRWKVLHVCISDLVFNALLLIGISASTPLVMTVGTMAVIPVSFAVDLVRKGYRLSVPGVVGSMCVISGIVLLSVAHGDVEHDEERVAALARAKIRQEQEAGALEAEEITSLLPLNT